MMRDMYKMRPSEGTFGIGIKDLTEALAHAAGDGALYVLEFSDGTIKPGRSTDPVSRLRSHAMDGAKFGYKVLRWWVSDPDHNFTESEHELLLELTDEITPRAREYFPGMDYEFAVGSAQRVVRYSRSRQLLGGPPLNETYYKINNNRTTLVLAHRGDGTAVLHLDRLGVRWYDDPLYEQWKSILIRLGSAAIDACYIAGYREQIHDDEWGVGTELVYIRALSIHAERLRGVLEAAEAYNFGPARGYILEYAAPEPVLEPLSST